MALSLMDRLNNTPDDIYRYIIEFVGVDIPVQKYSSIVWCNLCGENKTDKAVCCSKSEEFGYCRWCEYTFRIKETTDTTCCPDCSPNDSLYYPYPSDEDFFELYDTLDFYNECEHEAMNNYDQQYIEDYRELHFNE